MRILIVEDEKVSRKKMQIILANFGVCDESSNGSEALTFKNILMNINKHGEYKFG